MHQCPIASRIPNSVGDHLRPGRSVHIDALFATLLDLIIDDTNFEFIRTRVVDENADAPGRDDSILRDDNVVRIIANSYGASSRWRMPSVPIIDHLVFLDSAGCEIASDDAPSIFPIVRPAI